MKRGKHVPRGDDGDDVKVDIDRVDDSTTLGSTTLLMQPSLRQIEDTTDEASLVKVTEGNVRYRHLEQESLDNKQEPIISPPSCCYKENAPKSNIANKNISLSQASVESKDIQISSVYVSKNETASSLTTITTTHLTAITNTNIIDVTNERDPPSIPSCTPAMSRDSTINESQTVIGTDIDEGIETPSSEAGVTGVQRDAYSLPFTDVSRADSRNITVIDIKREHVSIGIRKGVSSYAASDACSSISDKPREITGQQQKLYPSFTGDNPVRSVNARQIITTDIPQSLSTDSGIGSPLDSRVSIDPILSPDMELVQDGKWKVGNCPVSSLATGAVPPSCTDRSENCRTRVCRESESSLSSRSDTSNYPRIPATTRGQSFHACAFSKHDSIPENSPSTNVKGNVEPDFRTSTEEKENVCESVTASVSTYPQKETILHENRRNVKFEYSLGSNTDGTSTQKQRFDSKDERTSVVANLHKETSIIHTIETSEFTVEHKVDDHSSRSNDSIFAVGLSLEYEDETSPCRFFTDTSMLAVEDTRVTGSSSATRGDLEVRGSDASDIGPEDNLQELNNMSDLPHPGRKVKGILKTTNTPTLAETRERLDTQEEVTDGEAKGEVSSSRSVSFNNTHTKTTFSYNNIAFEGEIITEPSKKPGLAEVVSHMMRQSSAVEMDEDNSHPYGRDNSLTDLMTGKRRDNYNMDTGKMIVWLALAIMIVSLAGGIIFMSETYNINHREQEMMMNRQDTTTPEAAR